VGDAGEAVREEGGKYERGLLRYLLVFSTRRRSKIRNVAFRTATSRAKLAA
jgi:hypothetical protein